MTKTFSPKRFFRDAPNQFLQQYFAKNDLLTDFDFEKLSETKIDSLYEAWLNLPDEARKQTEQDFQDIDDLACEAGITALIDEVEYHGDDDFAKNLAKFDGFHAKAFWIFLEKPEHYKVALSFCHSDLLPDNSWVRRTNVPQIEADVSHEARDDLKNQIGEFFYAKQGRGKNCVVECYRRNDLDYFFCYPEDFSQSAIEWENNRFGKRRHRPAFELIFVYSQKGGKLDFYLKAGKKIASELQAIFAHAILHCTLGDDEVDERVYDLSRFKSRNFEFKILPEMDIESAIITKMRLSFYGTKERVTLEVGKTDSQSAIYDLLDKLLKNSPMIQYNVTQVTVKVNFRIAPNSKKGKSKSFNITFPCSCSLKHEGRDLKIRQMLAESGIEPKELKSQGGGVAA